MPWALFLRDFNFDRPNSTLCFHKKASPVPQIIQRDIYEAAIKSGAAIPASPDMETRKSIKRAFFSRKTKKGIKNALRRND